MYSRAQKLLNKGVSNFLLIIYLTCITREFLWGFPNIAASWVLSLFFSVAVILYLSQDNKQKYKESFFWFSTIIALPLLFVYVIRFVFPDVSFDVLNYHLINSERAVRGFPFLKGDSFYTALGNPLPDMITWLFRDAFGYRLGTITNFIVVVYSALKLNQISRNFISNYLKRYLLIASILLCTGILYEINNYMVDLLVLPIILEILDSTFYHRKNFKRTIYVALLCGITIALKLTNITIVLPLALVFILRNITQSSILRNIWLAALFALIVFLPSFAYTKYIYDYTGSPVYPYFNNIFKSPYWSEAYLTNPLWGPKSLFEKVAWPVLTSIDPYSARNQELPERMITLSATLIASLLLIPWIVLNRKHKYLQNFFTLFSILFISSELWGLTSGSPRYGVYLYLISGLMIMMLFSDTISTQVKKSIFLKSIKILLVISVVTNIYYTVIYLNNYEYSSRPHIFVSPKEYIDNLKYVLKDYNLMSFQSERLQKQVANSNAWIASSPVMSGYMVLLNNKIPIVDLTRLHNNGTKTVSEYQSTLKQMSGYRFISFSRTNDFLSSNINTSLANIKMSDFTITSVDQESIKFFSSTPSYSVPIYVIAAQVSSSD